MRSSRKIVLSVYSLAVDIYIKLIYHIGMPARKKTRFAILGLLAWKPMSGYDVKKVVDVGLSHFWKENYGQIYPTLDQLVNDGLATKTADQKSGKRRRFVYTITSRGRDIFRDWINEPTDAPVARNELLLKFFLCSSSSAVKSIRLIENHRSQQQVVLQEYRLSEKVLYTALREGQQADELSGILAITGSTANLRKQQLNTFYLTLRHGIRVIEARLAWCDEAIANLKATRVRSRK